MPFHAGIIFSPTVKIAKGEVIPFVEMANVRTGNSREPIDIEMRAFRGGTKFALNDTVVASIEPCLQHGKSFFVKNMERGAGSTEFMVFRGREGVTADRFVYYLMCTHEIRERMIRSMKGATGRQRVDPDVFDSIEIEIPDIRTQEKITSLLWDYDSAIDNARRQIALLEEAAMRLYREWFVVHTDQKWENGAVRKWFEITIGRTPPRKIAANFSESATDQKWCSIKDLQNSNIFISETAERLTKQGVDSSKIHISPAGTIFLSFKLTVGKVAITLEPMATNEAIAHFETTDRALRDYTYCYLHEFQYDTLGSTSSIGKAINSEIVRDMPFVMPDAKTLTRFSDMVSPIFDQIQNSVVFIRTLTEARDRLLPKLMSGEVSV